MATPEYCFLWIDWWPLCMPRAEWAGWMQFLGAVATIVGGAAGIAWQVHRQHRFDVQRSIEVEFRAVQDLAEFIIAAESWITRLYEASSSADQYRSQLLHPALTPDGLAARAIFDATPLATIPNTKLRMSFRGAHIQFERAFALAEHAQAKCLHRDRLESTLMDDRTQIEEIGTAFRVYTVRFATHRNRLKEALDNAS